MKGKFRIIWAALGVAATLLPMNPGARAAEPAAGRPERIVSLNLCADQYLMRLADKGQIAALSPLARNEDLSLYAEEAEDYPIVASRAEAVMALHPDLIITGAFTGGPTVAMLKRHGFPIFELPVTTTLADVTEEIRGLAKAIGQPDRGKAMIADFKRRMTERPSLSAEAPTALFYQRRGFATGRDSLITEVMEMAGLRNLMGEMGLKGTQQIPLEAVIAHSPDFLIVDAPPGAMDQGSGVPRHPALGRRIPPERHIYLPLKLLFCAGPAMADAVQSLKRQVADAQE